jgi:predicted RecB family nuclease
MWMTPWTVRERGLELEDEAVGFQGEIAARLKRQARSARERLQMYTRQARQLAKDVRTELEGEPKVDYNRLRWTLATLAQKVEEELGRY